MGKSMPQRPSRPSDDGRYLTRTPFYVMVGVTGVLIALAIAPHVIGGGNAVPDRLTGGNAGTTDSTAGGGRSGTSGSGTTNTSAGGASGSGDVIHYESPNVKVDFRKAPAEPDKGDPRSNPKAKGF